MKILVVGSGGREHAITWRLAQDAEKHELFCAPGNAGTAAIATNVAVGAEDVEAVAKWARENNPDLVVVGPEAPLVKGLVDQLLSLGIPAFGPVAAGARMEGSKRFAKEIMDAAGVPTGKAETFTDAAKAKAALPSYGLPVVVKADGLAAGKGVIVAETTEQAEAAIDDMLVANKFGAAGAEVLLEEFLHGEECSILAMVDGENAVLLPSSQDHKRIFDGDKGPNTGGMGAYSPLPFISDEDRQFALNHILMKTAYAMVGEGCPLQGVLYGGLMKTPSGIKVIEFNARFGDPETEVILPLFKSDIYAMFEAVASLSEPRDEPEWSDEAILGVVLASKGYPGSYDKGYGIDIEEDIDATIYHMGTASDADGKLVTSGGRVMMAVCKGETVAEAREKAAAAVAKIHCSNLFHRSDIGWQATE